MYGKIPLLEEPIPINVEPILIHDEVPSEEYIRAAVKEMKNSRAGGVSRIQAKDIKSWLRGMIEEEKTEKVGAGESRKLSCGGSS